MIQYNTLNIKKSNSQPLKLSSNVVGDSNNRLIFHMNCY